MKKTLRFFGLALLATALTFTACSKDDDDDNNNSSNNTENNGGNNGGNNQGGNNGGNAVDSTTAYGVNAAQTVGVLFKDGKMFGDYTIGWTYGLYWQDADTTVYYFAAALNNDETNGLSLPYARLWCKYNEEKGFWVSSAQYFDNIAQVNALTEVNNNRLIGNWSFMGLGEGSTYNIEDLESGVISFTLHMNMGNLYDYVILENHDNPAVGQLSIQVISYPFEKDESKNGNKFAEM